MASSSSPQQQHPPQEPQPPQPAHPPPGFQPLVYNARNTIPYAPIPLPPQQAFEAPEPAPNRPWELTKTGLHVLSVVLGVVGIGLGFSTLKYEDFYAVVLISAIPPCMIALVWSLAELLVRLIRRLHAGIHPGAHVALSLIIFLLGAILPSLFGPWFQDSWYGDSDFRDCNSVYDPVTRRYNYTCTVNEAAKREFMREKRVALAAAVVTFLVAVLHFGLFVGACVDTDRVNRLAKRPIYVVAPPQMMQWQPVQQPMQQQQQQQQQQQYQPPVQQAPVQPPAQETPQTEDQGQSRDIAGNGKAVDKGKGKAPMLNPVVEDDAPSGSQA